MSTTSDPRRFGRVAVAYGGNSAEREVSLDSGRNVLAALRARGVDAHPVDGIPALLDALRAGHYARVFNILHGRGGEDGMLQGALDALRIPYTGSGILGSALAMDKVRSKRVWQALSLPTPAYAAYRPGEDLAAAIASVSYPAIVKPSHEGSSVGISRVDDPSGLAAAIEEAHRWDPKGIGENGVLGAGRVELAGRVGNFGPPFPSSSPQRRLGSLRAGCMRCQPTLA